ncbi:MAG TPA: AraC family transcriptional regulator [Xanthobacteraceae bacterium]|nr:AraC family transcriptional regulator [Xanthobacteraceae bacterium]
MPGYGRGMTKQETRLDYGRRIARVTDFIAANLDSDLNVERLAEVATFSPFHFHRIYREATGETLTDTVRRLRLHRAAVELMREDAALEWIAKRAGYGTLAAFSRAFSADYGVPPGTYRLRGALLPPNPKRVAISPMPYLVEIAPFAGARLAAIEHRGDYQTIGNSFAKVQIWFAARKLPVSRSFGIYFDDPESIPEQELRAEAGLVTDENITTEDNGGAIRIVSIPPMLCASVLHKGPYAELEHAYRHLFRDWLPDSGYEAADFSCFEEYLNDPRELPPSELLTRVHLPIKGEA